MSKLISNFFKGIWKIIDKIIINPITKLVLKITGLFDGTGKKFESWISRQSTLLFISLFMAIIIFIVVDQKLISFSNSSAEVFKNQKVNVIYNEEAYVIEGLPETVDVTLIGSKADLYIAKQSSDHSVTVDLTGLKPGTHRVALEYDQGLSSIEYGVNPSIATVIIYEKVSDTKTLTYDILNKDKLNNTLTIESVTLDTNEVTIRGSEYKIKQVATVKALINIENLTKKEVGVQELNDIELKAYDKDGNVVDVEFVPGKVNATIEIASPSKEVPLNFVPVGDLPFGKAISSYSFSENKVTLYGDSESLANIDSIDIEVNVQNLTSDSKKKVDIPVLAGVKSMSINNVTVSLSITDISSESKEFSINLVGINTGEGLVAQPVDEDNATITVEVQGASSVIESITADDITVYVDLKGYTEGEYDLDIKVKGNNPLATYITKKTKAKIKVSKSK
jgi:YbbR domain-containing protein